MSIVQPTRAPGSRRFRTRVATLGAVALAASAGLIAASPAQAAERPVDDGSVHWGFKSTFRNYVAGSLNDLPAGERITVAAPASFDPNGTPATPGNGETLPYLLPVSEGSFTDNANFTLQTSGGWAYHFPSHFFEIEIENLAVVVDGGAASIKADVATEITQTFGGFPAGSYGGTGLTIATISNPGITVSNDTVTVNATGVTLTEDGRSALPLYPVGEPLDNLSLTAALGTVVEPPTWNPQLSLSKQTGFNPDGSETVTVTGTGFDPAANVGVRPPKAGQLSGVYVIFGKFADTWRPSAGAPSSARKVINQRWALPEPSLTQSGGVQGEYIELKADGSFSATLNVTPDDSVEGNYGVYTFPGSGAVNASHELYVPITFATPGTSDGDLDIDVTVPEQDPGPGEPGEFLWRVDGGVTAVSLGTAAVNGDRFAASGNLAPIVVTDTRVGGPSWSVSAQVSDFSSGTGSFEGKHLGWTPGVTSAGAGAVAGLPVPSGFTSGSGLADSRTLGAATGGHAGGSATLGAALDLQLPLSTPAGDYTGTLTITAVS